MPLTEELKEAIAWRVRVRDGDAEDWDALVQWLEADPARSVAYDQAALMDQDLDAGLEVFSTALTDDATVDHAPERRAGRAWVAVFAALAAMLLIVIGVRPFLSPTPDRYAIVTAAGERKTVALQGGGSVALNGATRIVLDRGNPRYAELAAGEATFTVRHDPEHPFEVVSGDDRVRDVGTTFNLLRDDKRFEIEVAEGEILYNPDGENVTLRAGQALRSLNGEEAVIESKAPGQMASWRNGQLSYSSAPLAIVASDVSRNIGVAVDLDQSLQTRNFSGSVRIDGQSDAVVTGLAATLGLRAHRTADGWRIEPLQRATR